LLEDLMVYWKTLVNCIFHAIYHLEHKYRSGEEKKKTHHALRKCFIVANQAD
jgi:hypothetical protein